MGMGNRKRKGGKLSRRRTRRIGFSDDQVPRSGIRRKRTSSGGIFSCCCGAFTDPVERNQEDIALLHQAQKEMLASFKHQVTEISGDQGNPVWHASHNQDRQNQMEGLQKEQIELFKDMLLQQSEADDSNVTQELYKQQCELVEQMRELQMAGYAYPEGIPSPLLASEQKEREKAEEAENSNFTT